MPEYGSREWFQARYGSTSGDPWGLDWRPTQQYRYGTMIGELLGEIRLNPIREGLVVDVGCATGGFTLALSRALTACGSYRTVGVDLSSTAIERARERTPHIEFHVGSLEDAAIEFGGSASIVLFLEVLYYTPQDRRAAAIELLKSMMKPGGLLLISSTIGKSPYLGYDELAGLVGQRFTILKGGCLNLWPLVVIERAWLKFAPLDGQADQSRYLPGNNGFVRIQRLSRVCSGMFGRRSGSHAYFVARA